MVHINGQDEDVAGMPLLQYLEDKEFQMGTFVVECNEVIIPKEEYEKKVLEDGDIIEIVQFMGGGTGAIV